MSDTPSALAHRFPVLETPRLILRPLTFADLDFVFRHFSDPAVTQYMLDEPPLADLAQARELIKFYQDPAGNPYNRWGLERKEDGALIGTCGYHNWQRRYFRAEVGYDLSPAYWGQGYMSEALRTAFQHGFTQMQLHRIEALVYPQNVRSLRLLQKLGFQQEGLLRDYFCLDGQFYDHALLSLLQKY